MSNETVEVPVDLLKQLAEVYHNTSDADHYAVTSAMPDFIKALVELIPAPPKVGDYITGDQFAALPPLSVAIDDDGDVWVHTGPGAVTLVQRKNIYASHDDFVTDSDAFLASDIGAGTLVHIGWTEEEN